MVEQGSDAWKAMRCGKATASRISDIMAKGKSGGPSASRANYRAQLVCERLTGIPADSYESPAMAWGTATEAEARSAYQFYRGATVDLVDFVEHPSVAMSGCSPDGLIEDAGLVQFKCPNSATHIATLRGGNLPSGYMLQVQWEMACTGRAWCDWVSFDPRMPEEMRLFVQRVPRDPAKITEITAVIIEFLKEVDDEVRDLRARFDLKAAA